MSKISVIIPTYNQAQYVGMAIISVLRQTYQNFEIIVVDDGSTDDTRTLIEKRYGHAVRYFFQNNRGASAARNRGVRMCNGEHIIFLDADDALSRDALFLFEASSREHPDSVLYGPWVRFIQRGDECEVLYTSEEFKGSDMLEAWLRGWYVASCSIFWPKKVIGALGGWDEELMAYQDGEIAVRALIEGFLFHYCPGAYALVRGYQEKGASISSTIDSPDLFLSKLNAVRKIEKRLQKKHLLERYRTALAQSYYILARRHALSLPTLADICFRHFRRLSPSGRPPERYVNWILLRVLGLSRRERVLRLIRSVLWVV